MGCIRLMISDNNVEQFHYQGWGPIEYFAAKGDDTRLVAHQHKLLEERQNAAAQFGMHMYGFRIILKNTFATDDLDTVINQLVFRSQGHLQQFVDDRDSIWNARIGSLGLKARVDIPVAGTMIEVVNDRLRVEHPPMVGPSMQKADGKNIRQGGQNICRDCG